MLGRIQYLRRNRVWIKSTILSSFAWSPIALPRHYTSRSSPTDFQQNTEKIKGAPPTGESDKPIVNSGLSGMLIRFIQKESQILRDSMKIDESLDTAARVDNSGVSASMRAALDSQIDDYNRFLLLLTFHPLHVPPNLMMQYYLSVPAVLSQERTSLLKYLIFHNRWYDFWLVGVSDSTTLTDVEDLIDLVHESLKSNNNLGLGIWQALAAAHLVTSNFGLLNTICENAEFRLGLNKGAVKRFFEFLFSIQSASNAIMLKHLTSKEDLESNIIHRAFYLRKLLPLISLEDQEILSFFHDVQTDTELINMPGSISFLLSNGNPSQSRFLRRLAEGIVANRKSRLNDYDYFCILQTSPARLYPVYLSMCKNIKRNLVKSDQIKSLLVERSLESDGDLIQVMTAKFSLSISIETWSLLVSRLLEDSKTNNSVKRLSKSQPLKFHKVIMSYLAENLDFEDQKLLKLIEMSDNYPHLIRKILLKLSPNPQNLAKLVRVDLSAYNLLEVMRYALRHCIVNSDTFLLIDRVLHKTWDVTSLSRQASVDHSERKQTSELQLDDFRAYYRLSCDKSRKALLFNLQALSQTMSVTPPEVAAELLNGVKKFIESDSFTFVKSQTGKSYIFNRLVARTMHFIYKNNSLVPKKGVMAIRDVLSKLDFDSTVTQAALFEHIVYDDPGICIDILRNYNRNKSFLTTPLMEGIQIGILRSYRLSVLQRITLFEKFRTTMIDLGYKSKMSTRTMAKFGDLIFKAGQERGDTKSLGWVVKMGYERGVPVKVIKNWSIKLRS